MLRALGNLKILTQAREVTRKSLESGIIKSFSIKVELTCLLQDFRREVNELDNIAGNS